MSIKTEKLILDNKTYCATQLPATQATPILLDLAKYLGEPLSKLMGLKEELGHDYFFDELAKSFKTLETDKIMELINRLFENNVVCGKERINIDKHFSGDNLGKMFQVAVFVIRTNCEGFFSDLTGQISSLKEE